MLPPLSRSLSVHFNGLFALLKFDEPLFDDGSLLVDGRRCAQIQPPPLLPRVGCLHQHTAVSYVKVPAHANHRSSSSGICLPPGRTHRRSDCAVRLSLPPRDTSGLPLGGCFQIAYCVGLLGRTYGPVTCVRCVGLAGEFTPSLRLPVGYRVCVRCSHSALPIPEGRLSGPRFAFMAHCFNRFHPCGLWRGELPQPLPTTDCSVCRSKQRLQGRPVDSGDTARTTRRT